jgi:hypothetical protein
MSSLTTVTDVKDYIDSELSSMNRWLVATPESRENLDSFAISNQGSMDHLLTQMAVQYGYRVAMENVLETLNSESDVE